MKLTITRSDEMHGVAFFGEITHQEVDSCMSLEERHHLGSLSDPLSALAFILPRLEKARHVRTTRMREGISPEATVSPTQNVGNAEICSPR